MCGRSDDRALIEATSHPPQCQAGDDNPHRLCFRTWEHREGRDDEDLYTPLFLKETAAPQLISAMESRLSVDSIFQDKQKR